MTTLACAPTGIVRQLKGPWNTSLTIHGMASLLKDVLRISGGNHFANPLTIVGVITPIPGFLSLFISASTLEATQRRGQKDKALAKSWVPQWRKGSSREGRCHLQDHPQWKDEMISLFFEIADIFFHLFNSNLANYVLLRMLSQSRNRPIALLWWKRHFTFWSRFRSRKNDTLKQP